MRQAIFGGLVGNCTATLPKIAALQQHKKQTIFVIWKPDLISTRQTVEKDYISFVPDDSIAIIRFHSNEIITDLIANRFGVRGGWQVFHYNGLDSTPLLE